MALLLDADAHYEIFFENSQTRTVKKVKANYENLLSPALIGKWS